MAETSTMNSDNKVEQYAKEDVDGIKKEEEVAVKREQLECVVCVTRSHDCYHIYSTHTAASGSPLHHFLNKLTNVDLGSSQNCSKYICKSCLDLINVLEQAEIDYVKLKETFEAIISKNPLFETPLAQPIRLSSIKVEVDTIEDFPDDLNDDSDDEPLATQRKQKQHKVQKKKKKFLSTAKKRNVRTKSNVSWKCDECGKHGASGGPVSLASHKLAKHTLGEDNAILRDVKTEDSIEGSDITVFNNGFENCLKLEADDFDDDSFPDNDDDFTSSSTRTSKKKSLGRPKSKNIPGDIRKRKVKVVHQCDQCDAKYTSLARLEQHKQKHDGSKPPYICEVCGAHYKHKRACDIHIALHKGISDWKCEECNKLFPSKNALQRHNNIHTGKLNYQCDLCGKSFIHTSSFKMHKLSHSGVKPHACDVCGLALMTRSHLKRHKRVHSGEKRHECPICGKRFSERYNLAAHSKSHETSEPAAPQPPRRRLFRCSFCPERYERRYMLERHTSAAHGRTLERPPPTPRNTMSKLLKAQAQRRDPPPPAAPAAPAAPATDADTKDDRSSDSRTTPITPQKLIAQLSSTSILASGAWAGSYAAEFGLRHDFPH